MNLRWEVVQFVARCAYGCEVHKGELAVFGRRRFVLCKTHARGYGVTPPRNFKKNDDKRRLEEANAHDGKLRQVPVSDQ